LDVDSEMTRVFGTLPDGRDVHMITLRDGAGLEAEVLTYGGILRALRLDVGGKSVPLVLGLADLSAYLADRAYLGILVGRFAGRIARGCYGHSSEIQQLDVNEGCNHLHGGNGGFGRRLWSVAEQSTDRMRLALVSENGDNGYPGRLEVSAEYRLERQTLHLDFSAYSDAATPINLTGHAYFNLAGDAAVPASAHLLHIPADRYLPLDVERIPTGEIAAVAGTPFDFRAPATLVQNTDAAHPQIALGQGYDHPLLLAASADCTAELYSPHSGVAMRVSSNAPAVVLYEGQHLDVAHPDVGHGLCLEPSGFPDAPNHPQFPTVILLPGQRYEHRIAYRFAAVAPGSEWERAMAALNEAG